MKDSKSSDVQPLLNDQEKKVKTSSSIWGNFIKELGKWFGISWILIVVWVMLLFRGEIQLVTQSSQQNHIDQVVRMKKATLPSDGSDRVERWTNNFTFLEKVER